MRSDEVNELYDAFAERLIIIGGKPASTLSAYLKLTSLKETETLDSKLMVDELINDLKQLVLALKYSIIIKFIMLLTLWMKIII